MKNGRQFVNWNIVWVGREVLSLNSRSPIPCPVLFPHSLSTIESNPNPNLIKKLSSFHL